MVGQRSQSDVQTLVVKPAVASRQLLVHVAAECVDKIERKFWVGIRETNEGSLGVIPLVMRTPIARLVHGGQVSGKLVAIKLAEHALHPLPLIFGYANFRIRGSRRDR